MPDSSDNKLPNQDSSEHQKIDLDSINFGDANNAGADEEGQARLKELMEKEEKSTRALSGFWNLLMSALCVFMSGFYIYTAGTLSAPVQYQRGIYVMLTFILILMLYPSFPKSSFIGRGLTNLIPQNMRRYLAPENAPTLWDILLILLTIGVVGYYIYEFAGLQKRAGAYNETDFYIAIVGLFLSLEISRRVLGWSMTLIGAFFVLYLRYGYLLYDTPLYVLEAFAHRGRDFDRVATILYYDQEGVFGIMANVLVTYVILFIFFGAFLRKSGASRFFIDLPLALAGKTTGGPAKVSVIASALFGSISGSAIANTVSTGAFTIPLMKRAGFKPRVAGAIEPSASIGGMFMPPVMGAGAFLMSELTNIPYRTIVLIAIFPAFLYFLSVLTMVHFEAKKLGLKGIDTGIKAWDIIRKEWYMSLPLLIIVLLMIIGYSPGFAAFWSIISCIILMYTLKENKDDFSQNGLMAFGRATQRVLQTSYEALVEGVRDTLVIGSTVGVIGLIVGTIYATGIGLKFSGIIISMSGNSILLALILIALASLVLGMGVPVTAAYLIVVVLAQDALLDLGVSLIATHMIVYWFSQDSNITPPVCVAAYAGAAIAGSDPWKTGWTAFKFAKLLYIVPILFAYNPAMLLVGHGGEILVDVVWSEVALSYVSATIGTIAFSAATMFYLVRKTSWWEWGIFVIGTILCFFPNLILDMSNIVPLNSPEHFYYSVMFELIGIAIVSGVWFWQWYDVKQNSPVAPAQGAAA